MDAARQAIHAKGYQVRCEAVGGDFFQAVPPGGDLYVLKFILIDWKDAEAVRILLNCRTAIALDGKLLVIEMTIPDDNHPTPGAAAGFEHARDDPGKSARRVSMGPYWLRQGSASRAAFRRTRRFTCWKPSSCDLGSRMALRPLHEAHQWWEGGNWGRPRRNPFPVR